MQQATASTITFRNLSKVYRGRAVVDNVNFELQPGEVTGYLGPNGSGKSTTVKMLTGMIEPTSGQILHGGRNIQQDLTAFKRRLGYVPEEADVYPALTATEYLALVGRLRGLTEAGIGERTEGLLDLFGLHLRRHSPLSAYSKGMKQRVLISAALMHNPEILVLDEPLSGLDISTVALFHHLLQELASRGRIVLYISHVLELVERLCSHVIILSEGRVRAQGRVEDLRASTERASLPSVFAKLVPQDDHARVARAIVDLVDQ